MELYRVVLVPVLAVLHGLLTTAISFTDEYCESEPFNATCDTTSVILIANATYGRMQRGKCLPSDVTKGCKVDVRDVIANQCSGRHRCFIPNIRSVLQDFNPCGIDLRNFLMVTFTCLPVQTSLSYECNQHGYVEASGYSGVLASVIAQDKNQGTSVCPWMINAKPEQTILLTLKVFSKSSNTPGGQCRNYATVIESTSDEFRFCLKNNNGTSEHRLESHSARVWMDPGFDDPFLIYYKVVGCSLPQLPPNSYYLRLENGSLEVRCNSSDEIWPLDCVDGSLRGIMGNCSVAQLPQSPEHDKSPLFNHYGILGLTIVAVAIVVCCIIIIIGLIHIHRNEGKEVKKDDKNGDNPTVTVDKPPVVPNRHPNTPALSGTFATIDKHTPMIARHATVDRAYSPRTPYVRYASVRECTQMLEARRSIPVATPVIPERRHDDVIKPTVDSDDSDSDGDNRASFSTFRPRHMLQIQTFRAVRDCPRGMGGPVYFEVDSQGRLPEQIANMQWSPVCTCSRKQSVPKSPIYEQIPTLPAKSE